MNAQTNPDSSRKAKASKKVRTASGNATGLINLPFIRRERQKFPSKHCARVVLLQGPVGSFFSRAQAHLNANGFDTWRVCFNAGDRFYAGGDKTLNFSNTLEVWRDWFSEVLQENGFDAVVLFGAERSIHRIAVECAEEAGVPVICLEEGYVRPGFVTMELGGNNWRSPIAGKLPPPDFSSRAEGPKPVATTGSFSAMAWKATQYFTVRGMMSTRAERKLFHKQKRTVASEAYYWMKNFYCKLAHVGRNYKISERLLEHYDKNFYIVPLQVHDDTQLGRAANSWNNQKLILKSIVSFARNAPPESQLVFKIHPMERGHSRDWHFIRQVSALNDVKSRVHVLDGGSLSLLTRHSAGMITINSTSGLSAIYHGVPLAVLGQAIYRHPELSFCIERGIELDRFWSEGKVAPEKDRLRYLRWINHECLVGGDFYAKEGMGAAISALQAKIEKELAARKALATAKSAEIISGKFPEAGRSESKAS